MNRRVKGEIREGKEWLLEFYAHEKNDLIENLPKIGEKLISPLLSSMKFSGLGKASGVSRQLKSLEKDLITDYVDSKIPGAGGLAAKYVQKHPILLKLLEQVNIQGNGEAPNNLNTRGVM